MPFLDITAYVARVTAARGIRVPDTQGENRGETGRNRGVVQTCVLLARVIFIFICNRGVRGNILGNILM